MGRGANEFSRREVKDIALKYVSSKDGVSASYFCGLYRISEGVFYNILKRSIVESIVDDDAVESIGHKSSRNSAVYGGEGGRQQSINKHVRLVKKRKEFQFSFKDKAYYAIEYANSPKHVDVTAFLEKHALTLELFKRTIRSAIVDGCVNDNVAKKVMDKALQHCESEKVISYFDALFAERRANMMAKREHERQVCMRRDEKIKNKREKVIREQKEREKAKREHKKFIQLSMVEFGIPDEMAFQRESLGLEEGCFEDDCDFNCLDELELSMESEENNDSSRIPEGGVHQISFFEQ